MSKPKLMVPTNLNVVTKRAILVARMLRKDDGEVLVVGKLGAV